MTATNDLEFSKSVSAFSADIYQVNIVYSQFNLTTTI